MTMDNRIPAIVTSRRTAGHGSRRNAIVAAAVAAFALAGVPTHAQKQEAWSKCATDRDCVLIRGACQAPEAAALRYRSEAQRAEDDLAARILATPSGAVSCGALLNDPWPNARPVCEPDARRCRVEYPPGEGPRFRNR